LLLKLPERDSILAVSHSLNPARPGGSGFIPSCRQMSKIVILSEAKNLDSSLRGAPFRMTLKYQIDSYGFLLV
jgi:hypothetical protein